MNNEYSRDITVAKIHIDAGVKAFGLFVRSLAVKNSLNIMDCPVGMIITHIDALNDFENKVEETKKARKTAVQRGVEVGSFEVYRKNLVGFDK